MAFKKYLCCEGGEGVLKKLTKINRGREGQGYLYVYSLNKIASFFKQQTKFFLTSCLAVAKGFAVLSLVQQKA